MTDETRQALEAVPSLDIATLPIIGPDTFPLAKGNVLEAKIVDVAEIDRDVGCSIVVREGKVVRIDHVSSSLRYVLGKDEERGVLYALESRNTSGRSNGSALFNPERGNTDTILYLNSIRGYRSLGKAVLESLIP